MATDPRPILAIDVDGVLNAMSGGSPAKGWQDTKLQVVTGERSMRLRVRYNPAHGAQLLALAAETGAELIWCTTWEELACMHIGPLVGLPDLPWVPMDAARFSESLGPVKARSLAAYAGGRPFCWLDDEPDVEGALSGHPVPCKVVWVDERAGLQDHHLRRASEWLRSLGPEDGCDR